MPGNKNDTFPLTDNSEQPTAALGFDQVQNTSWSVVRAAGDESNPAKARLALSELARRYRAPVQAFIEHEGYSKAEAEALTQLFLAQLEQPGVLRMARAGNERFRVWLMDAVQTFLSGVEDEGDLPLDSEEESAGESSGVNEDPGESITLLPSQALKLSKETFEPVLDEGFAGYQIIGEIGRGGEGVVYRAWDPRSERQVALKILKQEFLVRPDLVQRFRKAVELSGTLDHPNIVRIFDRSGPEVAVPFYTMPLIPGGTLAQAERRERFRDPTRAAALVVKIARAIQYAHEHGILHRDLSPANILLDLNDEPYVSDFMAKRIGEAGDPSIVGALNYMAPEQALGKGSTVATDVYGLGAILYLLLTGQAPVDAKTREELRQKQQDSEPPSVVTLVRHVNRDLDAVCSAALSGDPAQRPRSAALFADSLERVLDKHPPLWPAVSRRRRIWLWATRHPLLAMGAFVGAALLVAADIALLSNVRSEERELEAAVLHSNAALASAQAHAVLAIFEKYAAEASRAASDPGIRDFLLQGATAETLPALERIFERSGFDSVGAFSAEGKILARHPAPAPGFLGRDFTFRQYFHCVRELADKRARAEGAADPRTEPEVCISPAYRGEASKSIEFTVAAPVHDAGGQWLGFVIMNRHAKPTIDEVEINDTYFSGQTTALFGQRDRDRATPSLNPSLLTAVAHPNLFSTEEHALDADLSQRLREQFGERGAPGQQLRPVRVKPLEEANYTDPVTLDSRLAGFAPVGSTGFVVAVSTPRERALGSSQRHIETLWKYAGLLNLGFIILAVVAVSGSLRGSRGQRGRSGA
ncbi:MAG: hypothetical protein RJA70_1395 [Pseudomonadota bacterium]|jgi:serine/threonine-protein kinase